MVALKNGGNMTHSNTNGGSVAHNGGSGTHNHDSGTHNSGSVAHNGGSVTRHQSGGSVSGEKDEVDPITMLLYQLHNQLSTREVVTMTAIVDVPAHVRCFIEDGIDLFTYLTDKDKLHSAYLEMLLTSIRRPDLVETVQRFYQNEWRYSAYAFTIETYRDTGEIPVVPRSSFKTVEITEKYAFDVYVHHTEADKEFAEELIERLLAEGVTVLYGDFKEIWTTEPVRCRYCIAIISKSYVQLDLVEELSLLLKQEINPNASLRNIIPVLNGMSPDFLADMCPSLDQVSQFSFIGGMGEYVNQTVNIVHKGLKTSINNWYKPAATLHCTSKHQSGKTHKFDVSLSSTDSFTVGRSEFSVLFRGDKGIKGLRDTSQNGHCVIETEVGEDGRQCVCVRSMGHPLTFVAVTSPIYIPHGVSTLLLGREWISIASKRNASQCNAKIRLSYLNEEGLEVKIINPSIKEEACFLSSLVIGSGDGSNLKLHVPGVNIAKQHCKLTRTDAGWLLMPCGPSCHIFLQLPREPGSERVFVPSGGEILVGTHSTIKSVINTEECDLHEDEGIGLSETLSRMSGKTT